MSCFLLLHLVGLLYLLLTVSAFTRRDLPSSSGYGQLQKLGASCSPYDTCAVPFSTDQPRRCHCDTLCAIYDDCCVDVKDRHLMSPRAESFHCFDLNPLSGVYVRDTCGQGWSNRYIRRRCESSSENFEDPFDNVPVTNTKTLVSYKNYYCAICNNDVRHMALWRLSMACFGLTDTWSNGVPIEELPLKYDAQKNEWGVLTSNASFVSCDFDIETPTNVPLPSLRKCFPHAVSRCEPAWQGATVRSKCESYTAIIYHNQTTYKNVHCAICNRVKPKALSCESTFKGPLDGRPAPFPVLIDYNTETPSSNRKGRCPKQGEVYDPFFKKCRNIVCGIPKYVHRNGKCVRE